MSIRTLHRRRLCSAWIAVALVWVSLAAVAATETDWQQTIEQHDSARVKSFLRDHRSSAYGDVARRLDRWLAVEGPACAGELPEYRQITEPVTLRDSYRAEELEDYDRAFAIAYKLSLEHDPDAMAKLEGVYEGGFGSEQAPDVAACWRARREVLDEIASDGLRVRASQGKGILDGLHGVYRQRCEPPTTGFLPLARVQYRQARVIIWSEGQDVQLVMGPRVAPSLATYQRELSGRNFTLGGEPWSARALELHEVSSGEKLGLVIGSDRMSFWNFESNKSIGVVYRRCEEL